jgi:hypothetical protein
MLSFNSISYNPRIHDRSVVEPHVETVWSYSLKEINPFANIDETIKNLKSIDKCIQPVSPMQSLIFVSKYAHWIDNKKRREHMKRWSIDVSNLSSTNYQEL